MRIGDIVLWRSPVRDGEKTSPSYPAIVFEVKPDDHLGLIVFGYDLAVRKYGHTPYDLEKCEAWRKVEEE